MAIPAHECRRYLISPAKLRLLWGTGDMAQRPWIGQPCRLLSVPVSRQRLRVKDDMHCINAPISCTCRLRLPISRCSFSFQFLVQQAQSSAS